MPDPVLQAAAIPVQNGRICLVTSRSGRRWVIPKGRIERGQSPSEAAILEAWEEAGLVGDLSPVPLGTFQYEKLDRVFLVSVYVLSVKEIRSDWPERRDRRREWVEWTVALERIEEEGLREILRSLQPLALAD